ncbi:MAG TPA: response regulator [Rhodocyclaceae bacterium]
MAIDFGALSALLVEPSGVQSRIIAQACKELGVTTLRCAQDIAGALAQMAEARPDVVISALYLADGAGTNLIAAMRANPDLERVAFILVSSETRPQALDPVRQAGVCAIVPKPFSSDQLRRALSNTVDFLSEDSAQQEFDAEALRVLLVDDSPSARRFTRRVLENLGVQDFIEADDGKQAVTILAETMVDLVVTDYNMPEMDGKALVDHIRQRSWQASVPILMVTSESDFGRLAAVEEAGVSGICDKPFDAATVRRLLGRMLGGERE